ncbi:MAG: S8 family peptidase [Anditalea sp.]
MTPCKFSQGVMLIGQLQELTFYLNHNILMFKDTFTRKTKVVFFSALLGLASCQPYEFENPEKEDQLLETTSSQLIESHYIVVLKQEAINARFSQKGNYHQRTSAMKSAIAPILKKAKIPEEMVGHMYSSTVLGFSAPLDEAMLERLRKEPEVSYIEQDRIITIALPWERGEEDPGDEQEIPPGITRVGGAVDHSSCDNVAWIIDSGIDLDHPDLNVEISDGFNAFSNGRDAQTFDDGNGHGTLVAGTIAAIDNTIGVVGVAAGATVIPIKVLNSEGSGTYSGVIAGVDHVAANGKKGDVANMSLGGPESQALDEAIVAAAGCGIIFCLSAGNNSDDANNYSPARTNGKNVYTISAMDQDDYWASFSNFGNPPVDFCAPGVSIKSTWKDGGYHTISGTSMATPHAAGVFLVTGGKAFKDGKVMEDPDGTPDPIIVHKSKH